MNTKITLIIPDLHLRWRDADKIIENVKHDEIILLGDYFDDFDDTPEMVTEMAEWFVNSVKQPNRIHLRGNHDVSYEFPYQVLKCSGYQQWKDFIINDIVSKKTWNKLKWFHVLDDKWLLTHAGLHNINLPDEIKSLTGDRPAFFRAIENYLEKEIRIGLRAAANNIQHWTLSAGGSRGGNYKFGGITWCDFEREFLPIRGLNQIFGHTPQKLIARWMEMHPKTDQGVFKTSMIYMPTETQINDINSSHNLDLDVWRNTHYAVWDGRNLTINDYNSL